MRATGIATSKAALAARKIRLHQYAWLLGAELTLILVYPFFANSPFRQEVFRACSSIVVCSTMYALMGRGRVTVLALALGIPPLGIVMLNLVGYARWLHTFGLFLSFIFLGYMSVILVWTILTEASVTADTLAGSIAAYLLIGITFGIAYTIIDTLIPNAFKDTIEPGKHFTQSEFTFFSFVTLTTVGYGDIVPWTAFARALAMIESVIGTMYPAVLVARLVGLHGHRLEKP